MNEMRELTNAELEAVAGAGFWGWVGAIGTGALVGGAAGSEGGLLESLLAPLSAESWALAYMELAIKAS